MKPKNLFKKMLSHGNVKFNKLGLLWAKENNLVFEKNEFCVNVYFDDNVVTLMDDLGNLITDVKPIHIKNA